MVRELDSPPDVRLYDLRFQDMVFAGETVTTTAAVGNIRVVDAAGIVEFSVALEKEDGTVTAQPPRPTAVGVPPSPLSAYWLSRSCADCFASSKSILMLSSTNSGLGMPGRPGLRLRLLITIISASEIFKTGVPAIEFESPVFAF